MNLIKEMDRLQHCEGCNFNLSYGGVCDCGLDNVRAGVRELYAAANDVYSNNYIEYTGDIQRAERLGEVLSWFDNEGLDAQNDAGSSP